GRRLDPVAHTATEKTRFTQLSVEQPVLVASLFEIASSLEPQIAPASRRGKNFDRNVRRTLHPAVRIDRPIIDDDSDIGLVIALARRHEERAFLDYEAPARVTLLIAFQEVGQNIAQEIVRVPSSGAHEQPAVLEFDP